MEIIYLLLPASIILALIGLVAFIWSVKEDQFSDLETPPRRILLDPEKNEDPKP